MKRALSGVAGLALVASCGGGSPAAPAMGAPDASLPELLESGLGTSRLILRTEEACSDYPNDAIATFDDAALWAGVKAALSIGASDAVTCEVISGLTTLSVDAAGISSIVGAQNLTGLSSLSLEANRIEDLDALHGLTSLTELRLAGNELVDVTALTGLPRLESVDLGGNPRLTDLTPLLANPAVGSGDFVRLRHTGVDCADVVALRLRGAALQSDCGLELSRDTCDRVLTGDLAMPLDVEFEEADSLLVDVGSPTSPVARFFEEISRKAESRIRIENQGQLFFACWMNQYVPLNDVNMRHELFPHLLASVIKEMFRRASIHETDVADDLYAMVVADPRTPFWANCSSAANLFLRVAEEFGHAGRPLNIWNALENGHSLMEYYSDVFEKYVYFDPLYAAYFLSPEGVPAGVLDLVEEIRAHGFDFARWQYAPQKIHGFLSDRLVAAADPRYDYYNRLGYGIIQQHYFNFVSIRHDDFKRWGGDWETYDLTIHSSLSPDYLGDLWANFLELFSVANNQRYHITLYRLNVDKAFDLVYSDRGIPPS